MVILNANKKEWFISWGSANVTGLWIVYFQPPFLITFHLVKITDNYWKLYHNLLEDMNKYQVWNQSIVEMKLLFKKLPPTELPSVHVQ